MASQEFLNQGLTSDQASVLQEQYGKNELIPQKKQNFGTKVIHIFTEPMFLLLIVAAAIYFILGEPRDGAIMLVFVIGIIGIDVLQEWKTDKTLNALKDLSAPHIIVMRDRAEQEIASVDLVPGDVMLISEGVKIPADGFVLKASDLCVNESSLTGEADGVWKVNAESKEQSEEYWRKDYCYAGTLVTQGSGYILVSRIGTKTEYGKIGANVAAAPEIITPLQKQTNSLVKLCAGIAVLLFAAVSFITFFNIPDHEIKERCIESILSGITIAMSMIPAEFPVILTVFKSMGALRLAKKQSLIHRVQAVETLGAVSVLCVDKTGTITMNQMTVRETWSLTANSHDLCEIMGFACETDTYDPMEKAMLSHCESLGLTREQLFSGTLLTEYPFTNELKMMGHVWKKNGEIIIAAKGSPEQILTICQISKEERELMEQHLIEMSKKGLRVIAVGIMNPQTEAEIPSSITGCTLTFCGLIGLTDPPRESVKEDIKRCTKSGVRVVMITGDNGMTASSIAKQIRMPNSDQIITGAELDHMTDEELREQVKTVNIFSRVVPEHKMRIVKAFKDNGEVVAMTGDGVNDAPALKYAHIGIAMAKRGSEVSREAADLILLDDNFTTIVDTIKDGRRIYDNIRKAVGYVFTIHIPIALAALLAPLLHITPNALLLLPLHVVLLELVIDPTCSIVMERQPAESDIMERLPRNPDEKILTPHILIKSILQGLIIFAASFITYLWFLKNDPDDPELARTMGLTIILISNVFLVQVNSSNRDFALQSFVRLMKDKVMWMAIFGTIAGLLIILYSPLAIFLKLAPLNAHHLLLAFGVAAGAVLWYELVKLFQKVRPSFHS